MALLVKNYLMKWMAVGCSLMTITTFMACGDYESITPEPIEPEQSESVSATDSLPFPMDAYKDRSTLPGDNFFQYCNGGWLATTPTPTEGAIGSLYDIDGAMKARLEELKVSNSQVRHFFKMRDEMFDYPDVSIAYIKQQINAIPKPQSKEEAFHTIGKMMMDGVRSLINFTLFQLNGQLICYVYPYNVPENVAKATDPSHLIPLAQTRGEVSSIMIWIVEGMGLNTDYVYLDENLNNAMEALNNLSLDQLYESMINAWASYQIFAVPTDIDVTDESRLMYNYSLSYHLAQQIMPSATKEKYVKLSRMVRDTFRKRLQQVDWMSETTRNNALQKLDAMQLFVGYPDTWHMDCIPDIEDCQTFVEIAHRLYGAYFRLCGKLAGSSDFFTYEITQGEYNPYGKIESKDLTFVNAAYNENYNCIIIYPAMILPPLALENVSSAHDFALFAIIGHEITHGFDSYGSGFDELGNYHNWWTVADKMAFEDRQQKLIRCYDHLEVDPYFHPNIYGNGERTLSENIAELGGFLTALDAYKKYLDDNGFLGETYNEQLRKFYESYADLFRVRYSEKKWQDILNMDVHSPVTLRVNGVVMNTDLWYELYNVTRDNILYLPEESRTRIW